MNLSCPFKVELSLVHLDLITRTGFAGVTKSGNGDPGRFHFSEPKYWLFEAYKCEFFFYLSPSKSTSTTFFLLFFFGE
jgi:hypothetical protein